jgi:hypothetical protein
MVIREEGKLMDPEAIKNDRCGGPGPDSSPVLLRLSMAPGIEIKGHAFILSPAPCCSQTALPFWAKVIGRISNSRADEIMINVRVTLFGEDGSPAAAYSEEILLEGKEEGEFDVKLTDFGKRAHRYSIEVEEADGMEPSC